VADQPGTDVAVFDPSTSHYPALFAQEGEGSIAEVIEDNFGEDGFSVADLDRLKVPSGGGTSWDIPDEDPARFVEGVIIHKQPTRSFWFKARGEGGEEDSPPDCYSTEGKTGIGAFGKGSDPNPTGECAACPMNVFGSSDRGSGNGKACKEQMQVFLLQPEAILPIQVSLPPTSLKGFRKYMTRLASKGKSYFAVVSRFGLEVQKGGGQTYSVVVPSKATDLDRAEAAAARAYGTTIRGFLEAAAAERAANERQEADVSDTAPGRDEWRSDGDTAEQAGEADAPAAAKGGGKKG
jgi:hypothetical protein